MEMTLSNIEKAFLSLPSVAEGFGFAEIKKLMNAEKSADVKKWEKQKATCKQIAKSHTFFMSKEGKELRESEGIDWTIDRFYEVMGYETKGYPIKRSMGNRYTQVGKLPEEKVAEYEALCEADPDKYPRDLKEIIKWSKTGTTSAAEGEGEGEGEEGEGSSSETWVSVSVKGQNGQKGYSFRITRDGHIKGDAERVADVIAILTATNGGDELMPSIVEDDEDEDEF